MPRQILALSERYYRRMLYSCASLLSVAIICALVFLGYGAFTQFREKQTSLFVSKREQIKAEADRLSARVTQFAEMYGRLQRLYQTDLMPADPFLGLATDSGDIVTTPDNLTVVPFSVVSLLPPDSNGPYLATLLQLLRQISALPIFNPGAPGITTLNGYLYTSDNAFLAISPPLGQEERAKVSRQGREEFIRNLTGKIDAAFASEMEDASNVQGSSGQKVIWLNPSENGTLARDALTGLAVRTFLGHGRLATAVFSIPRTQFHQFFMNNEVVPGLFVLEEHNGGRLLTSSPLSVDGAVLHEVRERAIQAARDGNQINDFRIGTSFFITQNISGPGWIVAYSFSVGDILNGLHDDFIVGAFWALFALVFVWASALYFDKFVIGPLKSKALALIETRQFSQTIIDTLPVGVAVYAPDTRQLMLQNSVAAKMLEHSNIAQLEFYEQIVRECSVPGFPSGGNQDHSIIEAELRLRDGSLSYLGTVWSHTRFSGRDVVLLGMIDMNMHKAHEALMLEAKSLSEKENQAKSMFLAQVSHEIRTPLHGAIGHMELLAHDSLTPPQRQRVELVRHAFDMLMNLVNDLLDITKIEANSIELNLEPVNLNDLLEECASLFAPLALNKGLQFYCLPCARLERMVMGDWQRIMQILQNLVGNAVKFTAHGSISLSISPTTIADEQVGVRFDVADTGIGVSYAARQRIFESLEQADETISRRFGGTGLGLSLCRHLAELMGGEITLESREGQGSVFGVELMLAAAPVSVALPAPLHDQVVVLHCQEPALRAMLSDYLVHWGGHATDAALAPASPVHLVAQDSAAPLPDSQSSIVSIVTGIAGFSPAASGHRQVSAFDRMSWYRALSGQGDPVLASATEVRAAAIPDRALDILVAEDDHVNLTLIDHQLNALGYRSVRLTRDGAQALEQWIRRKPDILITDLGMPHLDGVALATEIRRRDPHAIIVAATAASPMATKDLQENLFNDVLHKPTTLDMLNKLFAKLGVSGAGSATAPAASLDDILRDAFVDSWPVERRKLDQALEMGDRERCVQLLHRLQGGLQAMGQDALAAESLVLQSKLTHSDAQAVIHCRDWLGRVAHLAEK